MGRLLKKKPVAQKKKKKLAKSAGAETEQSVQESGGQPSNLKVVAGKEVKKKPAGQARKSMPPAKAAAGPAKRNIIDKSLQFLREVKVELKKVTWPSRKQTLGSTVVVLILVSLISLFLGTIDIGLSSLVQLVLQ